MTTTGWQKLCEGTKGLRRKVWTWRKILSPIIRYFVAILRFVAIYALFGNLRAKKSTCLGQKQCFLGKKCTITWHIVHIILIQICKFAISPKSDAFAAKIVKMRLTKLCMAIFALDERLPTSATLDYNENNG